MAVLPLIVGVIVYGAAALFCIGLAWAFLVLLFGLGD